MNRSRIPREDAPEEGRAPDPAQAGEGERASAHRFAAGARPTYASRLESARLLLDRGMTREAEAQLAALIKSARGDRTLLARAHCALAETRAMEGRFNDSLAAVRPYASPEARRGLQLKLARYHIAATA